MCGWTWDERRNSPLRMRCESRFVDMGVRETDCLEVHESGRAVVSRSGVWGSVVLTQRLRADLQTDVGQTRSRSLLSPDVTGASASQSVPSEQLPLRSSWASSSWASSSGHTPHKPKDRPPSTLPRTGSSITICSTSPGIRFQRCVPQRSANPDYSRLTTIRSPRGRV